MSTGTWTSATKMGSSHLAFQGHLKSLEPTHTDQWLSISNYGSIS